MRVVSLLGASCALLLSLQNVYAAPDEEIVVTATRSESDPSRVAESVSIITGEQARESQKLALSDLLTTVPGVTVSRTGGLGKQTSLFIRGAESEQTLVLIDGVKLNDPSSPGGGYDFADLMVHDIDRIEVLRGAQSALWGSQAIGGVVSIITPMPTGPFAAASSVEYGSFGTGEATTQAQAGNEQLAWRVGGSYLTTDGISAFAEDLGGREEDGYRRVAANMRALWYINDAVTAEVRSYWWRGRSDIDGFPPPNFALADTPEYSITREWVNYAGININSLGGKLKHRLGVAHTDIERENRDPYLSVPTTFDAAGRHTRLEYQGTLQVTDGLSTVFGIEREESRFSTASPSEFDPNPVPLRNELTLTSAYGLVQFSPVKPLTLTAGLRYDDHETFGTNTTAQAGAAWSVTPSTLLRASYGEGFKAPTLYQLFSEFGTPSLSPEESEDWDLSVEQRLSESVVVSATYFDRDTNNMIDFVSCFGSSLPQCAFQPFGFYENVAQTQADGVELSLTAQATESLRFDVNYTHLNAENATPGANAGKDLRRRPSESANVEVRYQWSIPLTTSVAAQYMGRSLEDVANNVELDSYVLVDVRASYEVSPGWEIYGRVENLLDEEYETARRYGSPGRGVYAGFRTEFR
jgi:vitamin B12 transporter